MLEESLGLWVAEDVGRSGRTVQRCRPVEAFDGDVATIDCQQRSAASEPSEFSGLGGVSEQHKIVSPPVAAAQFMHAQSNIRSGGVECGKG